MPDIALDALQGVAAADQLDHRPDRDLVVLLSGVEVADIDKGEAWLHQMDVGVYAFAHQRNHDPRRRRKLLMHRREIDRLSGKIREKGYTLVPLSLYEKQGRVKAELALVHGKQQWDKREDSKKRESQREMDRAMSVRRR